MYKTQCSTILSSSDKSLLSVGLAQWWGEVSPLIVDDRTKTDLDGQQLTMPPSNKLLDLP